MDSARRSRPSAPRPSASPSSCWADPGTGTDCHAVPSNTQVCAGNAPEVEPGPESPNAITGRPATSMASRIQSGALYGKRVSERAMGAPTGTQPPANQPTTRISVVVIPGTSTRSA